MSNRKWTPTYVQQGFPAEVREHRRSEGNNPDVKPTHSWLREHGFSGIQGYAVRQGKTVDEVLLDECGFEHRERKSLPGTHAETKQLIHTWLQDEDEEFGRLNDTSVGNAWTHMRKLMEVSREELGSSNLLRPARASAGKNIRLTLDLFRGLNDKFLSEGTRYNYASTLASFYEYLELVGEVESNPAEMVLPRMGWSYNRESPKQRLTPRQVRDCWEATKEIDEEALVELDPEDLRKHLVDKTLLLCLAGCGHRTSDTLVVNAHEDLILDRDDPRVCFDEGRKNGPGTTPIMAGLDYFRQYIELLDEAGYEMLFPSERSEDGTRSDTWVRDRIESIVLMSDCPTGRSRRQSTSVSSGSMNILMPTRHILPRSRTLRRHSRVRLRKLLTSTILLAIVLGTTFASLLTSTSRLHSRLMLSSLLRRLLRPAIPTPMTRIARPLLETSSARGYPALLPPACRSS